MQLNDYVLFATAIVVPLFKYSRLHWPKWPFVMGAVKCFVECNRIEHLLRLLRSQFLSKINHNSNDLHPSYERVAVNLIKARSKELAPYLHPSIHGSYECA